MKAAIIGLAGPVLSPAEAALLAAERPVGAILFRRNVETPAQLAALTSQIRAILGTTAPILVDQEGGRVARLRPPHWAEHPPAASHEGQPAAQVADAARRLAEDCVALGLDVICAPCLDLRLPGAHAVIGDRAFSADPAEVARLGAAWIAGLQAAGAIPVIKHIPGHGRARADSHEALPIVTEAAADLAADIAPFRALAAAGAWAMTAHILYTAWDADLPATLSPAIIDRVIRGAIGFDGVLISDDLAMRALSGPPGELAAAAIGAGCDLALHCTGVLAETAALLDGCPPLSAAAEARIAAARDKRRTVA
jgi:beta-N-acetylhexosaminidase